MLSTCGLAQVWSAASCSKNEAKAGGILVWSNSLSGFPWSTRTSLALWVPGLPLLQAAERLPFPCTCLPEGRGCLRMTRTLGTVVFSSFCWFILCLDRWVSKCLKVTVATVRANYETELIKRSVLHSGNVSGSLAGEGAHKNTAVIMENKTISSWA